MLKIIINKKRNVEYLKPTHFPSAPVEPSMGLSMYAFWPSRIVMSSTLSTGAAKSEVSKKM